MPGIVEGAAQGKGRGKQVIAVARTADLVLMMLDATKSEIQRKLLEAELEAVGIRLNRQKPRIYFKPKKTGGVTFNSMVTLTKMDERTAMHILHEYSKLFKTHFSVIFFYSSLFLEIFNCDVLIREDVTVDDFIDVIVGNRKYMPCLYCFNKIDQITIEEVDRIAHQPNTIVISCNMNYNLDLLIDSIWEHLNLILIYTKKRGEKPNFEEGLIMRSNCTVEHVVSISIFFVYHS